MVTLHLDCDPKSPRGSSRPLRRSAAPRVAAVFSISLAWTLIVPRVTCADAPSGRYTIGTGAAAGTVYDTKTKLTWQRSVTSTTYTWANAKSACRGLSLNGAAWRLPTIAELLSIVDFSRSSAPLIDATAFPSTPSVVFWSSTAVVGSTPSAAWPVYFNSGFSTGNDLSTANYVRCVR